MAFCLSLATDDFFTPQFGAGDFLSGLCVEQVAFNSGEDELKIHL